MEQKNAKQAAQDQHEHDSAVHHPPGVLASPAEKEGAEPAAQLSVEENADKKRRLRIAPRCGPALVRKATENVPALIPQLRSA